MKKPKPKRLTARVVQSRIEKRIEKRLDEIERAICVIEDRTIVMARTLAPLVYDLRQGGWNIPTNGFYGPDGIAEIVKAHDE